MSGRLVAATWWLFGFIVIASYTANLAAFLTVSRLDHAINNFDELTRQYKVKYAPFEGSSTKTYFERMARIEEKFYQSVYFYSALSRRSGIAYSGMFFSVLQGLEGFVTER